jgi:hypothetical protein
MSIAAMSGRWLRRKVRQVGEGTLGRHGIQRPTVAWLILMPSLSSSPWMRGRPPQRVGFAHAANQITDVCADLGSSRTARSPPPKEPEALAVPLDHGGRLDQYHRVDDLWPNPVEPHP